MTTVCIPWGCGQWFSMRTLNDPMLVKTVRFLWPKGSQWSAIGLAWDLIVKAQFLCLPISSWLTICIKNKLTVLFMLRVHFGWVNKARKYSPLLHGFDYRGCYSQINGISHSLSTHTSSEVASLASESFAWQNNKELSTVRTVTCHKVIHPSGFPSESLAKQQGTKHFCGVRTVRATRWSTPLDFHLFWKGTGSTRLQ